MSVYVDHIREYGGSPTFRWSKSCHMYADTLEELHTMANAIGMKRAWFQDKPGFPHYDLVASRRKRAVALGAVEHITRQMVDFARQRRAEFMANNTPPGGGRTLADQRETQTMQVMREATDEPAFLCEM